MSAGHGRPAVADRPAAGAGEPAAAAGKTAAVLRRLAAAFRAVLAIGMAGSVAAGVAAGVVAYAAAGATARAAAWAGRAAVRGGRAAVRGGRAAVRGGRAAVRGGRAAVRAGRSASRARHVAAAAAGWALAAVTLAVCYLHVARTTPVTSDGASNALQAWDMLHGNLLLHGWQLSDVSFYTTELPEYMLIERLRGLTPAVVHVASALTYTALVLLAAAVAKGRASDRAALTRCLVAAGVMLAPQPGAAVSVLLGSPDHTGSAIPVLAAIALLDRAPRRWWALAAAWAVLAWALVADGIVLFTGVAPMAVTGLIRAYRARVADGARWRDAAPGIGLALAGLAAVPAAAGTLSLIAGAGGFRVWPVSPMLATAGEVPADALIAGRGLLMLFGAGFLGQPAGPAAALAGAHLAGLALAAWATCATIRRFGRADLASQLLAAGVACVLAAYVLGTRAVDLASARDITAVLPFGAALAGRVLAGRLAALRLLPAAAAVLLAYLVSLGQAVTAPPAPPDGAVLASWLAAHHLDDGLAGYWDANVVTLDSGGAVRLRSALADGTRVTADYWEVRTAWYDPRTAIATFVVLVPPPPGFGRYMTAASVRQTFGQPSRIYDLGRYTILAYGRNLLARLAAGSPPAPRSPPGAPPAPVPAPPGT